MNGETMKVFAATSSSSDSIAMLYKLLTETTDDVISRILTLDASDQDLAQYPIVCNWLKKNVRDFNFDFSDIEDRAGDAMLETVRSKWYNVALLSEMYNVDLICIGYNTYNWSPSNWYFKSLEPVENYYMRGNSYSRIDYSIVRDYTDIPIEWPLMNHKTKHMGRWQTWELLPKELQNLVSHCPCGKCAKCKCREWYNKKKEEGFSAVELDNIIMKEGKYGKYYTKDSITETRHDAYADQRFPVWKPKLSSYQALPTKPHNK
jgi:hypothetical protein